jgi:hypothetical protein
LDEFPALIEDMPSGGGGFDTSTVIDLIERDYTGEFVVPNGTTTIGNYMFADCSNLTSSIIPNTVTSIGN